jgi:CHASE3 domain sensor protein
MEEYPETTENARSEVPASMERKRWLIDFILVLVVAMLAFGYGYQQQLKVRHLAAQESVANETINDLQRQLNNMADKMNSVAPPPEATADAGAQSTRKKTAKTGKTAVGDKRYQRLETQLTEQQRQLKETQELVAKNRSELESSLSSTRDELNGSIARTHEELVALAKRGERSYFEFELTKSKEFQRFGPVPLSLRKTDTKHNSFDIALIVDDNQLMKKKVNLYEPIWIHTENESQPVQVVVNRITKNVVHGYVSAPKYKPSELATTSASTVNPAAPPQNTGGEPTKPEQPKR